MNLLPVTPADSTPATAPKPPYTPNSLTPARPTPASVPPTLSNLPPLDFGLTLPPAAKARQFEKSQRFFGSVPAPACAFSSKKGGTLTMQAAVAASSAAAAAPPSFPTPRMTK
jgi:hypothetical protein